MIILEYFLRAYAAVAWLIILIVAAVLYGIYGLAWLITREVQRGAYLFVVWRGHGRKRAA